MLDQELLEKLKEDINEGAALLLKEYSGFVWWVCSQRLSNPEDIRECVNQVFAEFCLKIESYDPGKSALKTYLCMIAERKSVDYLRKESIRHKIIVDEKEVDLLGAHEIEEEIISHADLEAALAQLNPDDEKIIRMNYYEGRSFQEIASELNFPYETIKKRNQRILKNF